MVSDGIERLSTGIKELDELLDGGIPKGFFVALTGEPGTGKTVLCITYINEGIKEGDKCVYVTTEESKKSIITQAKMFNMDFEKAISVKKLILVDALMGDDDPWSLKSLEIDELIGKIIEAKKSLGYGRARLVIDSLSAFWLDKPAMARRHSYLVKKVLSKWDFTIFATSQYDITTSYAFDWGVEHIADGIIRFSIIIRGGQLKRYILIEKMRQTNHSLSLHEIEIRPGVGLTIVGASEMRVEDIRLPKGVVDKIIRARQEEEAQYENPK
jgi:KaiC domain protein